jgi:ABC-type proline/glycine betaine transport system substrate-binding protein
MRSLLFTILCFCLLSTAAFPQTSPSTGGLVVFETFGLGAGTAATQTRGALCESR